MIAYDPPGGMVGQLIIEPKGSTWTDPATGRPVDSGTYVDINTHNALAPGLVNGSYRMRLVIVDNGGGFLQAPYEVPFTVAH